MAQVRFSMSVVDPEPVRRRLGRLAAERVTRRLFAEMVRGAILIEGRARRRAPVDMGRLRASLTHGEVEFEDGAFMVRVGTNVTYAKFVEFGTGPAGKGSELSNLAQEAMKDLGYVHGPQGGWPPTEVITAWAKRRGFSDPEGAAFSIQRAIRQRGSPAQPYLFPAFEESRQEVLRLITKGIREEFERP